MPSRSLLSTPRLCITFTWWKAFRTVGERYVGFTEDLKQRIADHNTGKNPSTAKHRPWKLNTYLAFSTKAQAMGFERYLKSGSGHAFARKRLW
jgi:predicted GIY-YIG superfamily endonuclease